MSGTIESVLQEDRLFPPAADFVKQANVSGMAAYQALCDEADADFEGFWARLARENLLWKKPFTKVLDESNAPFYRWFHDGELNASHNSLDRHLKTQPDKTALIFEADDGKVTRITYKALYHRVCTFANALKARGIQKGDRVLVYMPMSIEAVIAMQACARIAATHSVVFGGFSAKSLHERIIDAGAVAVITADGQFRGGKEIPLKPAVDEALAMCGCDSIKSVIVYKRSGSAIPMVAPRDIWWHDAEKGQANLPGLPVQEPPQAWPSADLGGCSCCPPLADDEVSTPRLGAVEGVEALLWREEARRVAPCGREVSPIAKGDSLNAAGETVRAEGLPGLARLGSPPIELGQNHLKGVGHVWLLVSGIIATARWSLSSSVCKWYSVDLLGREAPREADCELIADTRPLLRWHRPFPCDLTRYQEQQLARRLRARERTLGFRHLAQLPVVPFDCIRRVD